MDLGRFFSFLIIYTVGRTPRPGDQPFARPPPTHRTQTQNNRTQTFMPRVGFEPTIPVFERAKTVHALDRAATVIGFLMLHYTIYSRDTNPQTQVEDLENYITALHNLLQTLLSPYRLKTPTCIITLHNCFRDSMLSI
jgi:hypothetical protein